MYTVKIRQHIMIAHSLDHPEFGPARNLHGATYIVDATFYAEKLNEMNVVLDIGLAHDALKAVLTPLNYRNLDELPPFKGLLTTTEFLAKYIHDEVKTKVKEAFDGKIKITLGESHEAWASYAG